MTTCSRHGCVGALAAALLLGCPAPAPVPTPATPPGSAACAQSFAGEWEHVDDPSYRYRAEDDGKTLKLLAYRMHADGGVAEMVSPPEIVLERTPSGLVGQTRAQVFGPGGQPCIARFDTRSVKCAFDQLTLVSADRAWVDASCEPAARSESMREHVIRRRP